LNKKKTAVLPENASHFLRRHGCLLACFFLKKIRCFPSSPHEEFGFIGIVLFY
jgi:hypothetical protein